MVTGASSANLAIVLVDARQGVTEQSRRHTCIASLLRIPHLVIAVNKMDLVDWSEERFIEIRDQFEEFLPRLDVKDVQFIPLSALTGDNVVEPSKHTPWYPGPTLLGHLESVHIGSDWNLNGLRLPVQWVNRPNRPTDPELHDFRGFSGQIAGGIVRVGQRVMALPSGLVSTVKQIWTYDGPLQEAFCPQSITLVLEHDIDISRGDMIIGPGQSARRQRRLARQGLLDALASASAGPEVFLRHTTRTVQAVISDIEDRIDMSSLEPEPSPTELALNDIGEVRLTDFRAAGLRRLRRTTGLPARSSSSSRAPTQPWAPACCSRRRKS